MRRRPSAAVVAAGQLAGQRRVLQEPLALGSVDGLVVQLGGRARPRSGAPAPRPAAAACGGSSPGSSAAQASSCRRSPASSPRVRARLSAGDGAGRQAGRRRRRAPAPGRRCDPPPTGSARPAGAAARPARPTARPRADRPAGRRPAAAAPGTARRRSGCRRGPVRNACSSKPSSSNSPAGPRSAPAGADRLAAGQQVAQAGAHPDLAGQGEGVLQVAGHLAQLAAPVQLGGDGGVVGVDAVVQVAALQPPGHRQPQPRQAAGHRRAPVVHERPEDVQRPALLHRIAEAPGPGSPPASRRRGPFR